MNGVKHTARLLEVAVVVALILFFAVMLLKPSSVITERARATETKSNLHTIQLLVERYAVDHDSGYPAYLAGGDARWSGMVNRRSAANAFAETVDCPDQQLLADPLLAEGYMDQYPRNPFVRNGVTVHQAQVIRPLNAHGGDPLRNGVETGKLYGTRFGPYCTSMGQLLGAKQLQFGDTGATPAVPALTYFTFESPPGLPIGADVVYPCWDKWNGKSSVSFIPGNFTYSVAVEIKAGLINGESAGPSNTEAAQATSFDYVLTAFGGALSKGQDVIDQEGNPYNMHSPPASSYRYGNPNGIQDGIILLLHGSTFD